MDDDVAQETRETLLAKIEEQAKVLAERRQALAAQQAEIERQAKELREAQTALLLLSRTRVYRLARALGRWGWLERRIRRVLQASYMPRRRPLA